MRVAEIPTVRLAGMTLHPLTEREAIECIVDAGGGWVVNPNVDVLRQVADSPELATLVGDATLALADGVPLIWASRIKGEPLPERVAGSTLIHGLCAEAAHRDRSVYLLGGGPGIAERAADRLQVANPRLRIAGCHCPPFGFEDRENDVAAIEIALLNGRPDIVFVALGFPKQERLIVRLRRLLPDAWFIATGATLSFVAGETPRAPTWLQRAGLEWLFRLCHEPRRLFRRYVVLDTPFAVHMLVECACIRAADVLRQAIGRLRPGHNGSTRPRRHRT